MSYQDYQTPPEALFAAPVAAIGEGGGSPFIPTGMTFAFVSLNWALTCLDEAIAAEDSVAIEEILAYVTQGVANLEAGMNGFFGP